MQRTVSQKGLMMQGCSGIFWHTQPGEGENVVELSTKPKSFSKFQHHRVVTEFNCHFCKSRVATRYLSKKMTILFSLKISESIMAIILASFLND